MPRKKSTDLNISAGERKELRGHEAKEAIADYEAAHRTLHENHNRLRFERLARESATGQLVYAPELPDNTPLTNVQFPTRIWNALRASDWKTVGEIREATDAALLSLPDLGRGSVARLRETLGLPSKDGVRPALPKAMK